MLPNKTRPTHKKTLAAVKDIVQTANPKRILVDFESAPITEFQLAYPDAEIKGCYFHLSQSVYRKSQELGMKNMMEQDKN